MSVSDEVRIAVLEREMRDMKLAMGQVNKKLDDILDTLAQMSGGKKAVFTLFAIIGGFIGAGAAVISATIALWKVH